MSSYLLSRFGHAACTLLALLVLMEVLEWFSSRAAAAAAAARVARLHRAALPACVRACLWRRAASWLRARNWGRCVSVGQKKERGRERKKRVSGSWWRSLFDVYPKEKFKVNTLLGARSQNNWGGKKICQFWLTDCELASDFMPQCRYFIWDKGLSIGGMDLKCFLLDVCII